MPRPLTRAQIAELYRRLAEDRPTPKTELNYDSAYTLLVAVALSAQATDVSVNKATGPLFAVASTPEAMVALGEDRLASYIKTIGLWRTKAKNVIGLSQKLLDDYGGEVPADRGALQQLPGVGRKTADVVMNEIFDAETIAVDTHIFRVSNRTGLAIGKTPDAVGDRLLKVTPPAYRKGAHHWLILHGRYVCKARTPACGACVLREGCCHFPQKTPAPKPAR
ncbi:Nth, endonuclease III [Parvularcula bermudensis HTCC2503]|uniref:Endonuclease III n=1 Tax=Parvularcula bermudensis (strain ATCC BAA-594 / HTCC2503 / KCTC 12087) TaxID=314260 RepID=E0TEN6_PARBH|nr:endonuclease III [Parvularcula bermudensis]ADM08919.1 Nth, endonuclease III [Parvularcula bermudensis HTCC2503]